MKIPILISKRLFTLTGSILDALRIQPASRGPDSITEKYDAFMLYPGMGTPMYITSDGRIIWWDPLPGEGTLGDAYLAVSVGVAKTGIPELATILPCRPLDSVDCQTCSGTGWVRLPGIQSPFVCVCGGLGWRSPSVSFDATVIEIEDSEDSTF